MFKLSRLGPEVEEIQQEGEEEVPAAQNWVLPAQELQVGRAGQGGRG